MSYTGIQRDAFQGCWERNIISGILGRSPATEKRLLHILILFSFKLNPFAKSNPADLISRGVSAEQLMSCEQWLSGPAWLSHPLSLQEQQSPCNEEKISTLRCLMTLKRAGFSSLLVGLINKFCRVSSPPLTPHTATRHITYLVFLCRRHEHRQRGNV